MLLECSLIKLRWGLPGVCVCVPASLSVLKWLWGVTLGKRSLAAALCQGLMEICSVGHEDNTKNDKGIQNNSHRRDLTKKLQYDLN